MKLPEKVLLIEDSEAFQRLITKLLEDDFEVVSLLEATNAIEICLQEKPDIILLDIMLPGDIDGLTLLRTLKINETLTHIPVILISALASNDIIVEGLRLGANDYLVKPFDIKQLTFKIRNMLDVNSKGRQRALLDTHIKFNIKSIEGNSLIEEFDKIIEQSIKEDTVMFIPAIAKALNTSHSTLSREVKAKYDMTPNTYITNRKLEKALLLLKSNKAITIKEISFMLGFNSISYFSKSFKKKYGHYPSHRR